jgi:hypothetical protein
MNPEITQFDIIQSNLKLLQQLKKTLMLIYVITILNIGLIKFIMIVNLIMWLLQLIIINSKKSSCHS